MHLVLCRKRTKLHLFPLPAGKRARKRKRFGQLKKRVEEVIGELCRQRGVEVLEGHLLPDHIHMCLSIPQRQSVAVAIGFIKGKSAVRIHRELLGKE